MAKKPPPIPPPPLAVIRRARDEFGIREVAVGVSCGKDSLATLSLCAEHFGRISGYFLYIVPGLSFQERYLSYLESRFQITIHRLPHFMLGEMLRAGTFRFQRQSTESLRRIKPRDIDAHVRKLTGISWLATGEKAIDSVERNAMLRRVQGIDPKRRRLFPLTYWSHSTVYNHLKTRQILLPPEYSLSVQSVGTQKARSFGGLQYRDVAWIEERYPDDFKKIVAMFPLIRGQLLRYRQREASREQEAIENGQEEASSQSAEPVQPAAE
jgi:phosphoadenosine phosphosulfate reductase